VKFVYKPEGADVRSWDLDFDTMKASEWISIEKQAGLASAEFAEALQKGSLLAVKALLWVLLKRSMSTLSWDSLDFTMAEVDILDDDETAAESVESDPKA
jgi:hypothetical protein